ncbi:MAG: hypothetical protein A2Y38_12220 [Spirochaetes bacterium GWB1_59_5]|nr:MAG: hypothetical protein A2Y38_12220 [Spirochaetes bacterium GWB1_59_5]
MEGADLNLDAIGEVTAPPAQAAKFHKGKIEYAPPFYTINVQHVEHMPEYEVIGVNGEVIQVTRGVDVTNIPQAFVNVLRQAVTSKLFTSKKADGSGDELQAWRPVAAIPFSIVEGPYMERKKDE